MGSRDFRIALKTRLDIDYQEPVFATEDNLDGIFDQAKTIAHLFNTHQDALGSELRVSPAKLNASGILHILYQTVVSRYLIEQDHDFFSRLTPQIVRNHSCQEVLVFFAREFPSPALMAQRPTAPYLMEETARGFFIHRVLLENPALVKAAKPFVKPKGVQFPPAAQALIALMGGFTQSAPPLGDNDEDLFSFLMEPAKTHPDSLVDQITFILRQWRDIIPEKLRTSLLRAMDHLHEEERPRFQGGPGPSQVPCYASADLEYEAYSTDRNWMPNVVMMAKSVLVWLDQLSRTYGYPIETLDQIPDRELDLLIRRGFTGLWLIGLWERSPASKRIKNLCGNHEAEASAYSLRGYDIASSIGGWPALKNLDARCKARGIRLASDMVPNHTGIDSDLVIHHPEYFIRTSTSPFPSYTYTGEDVSSDPRIEVKIEDHYYDRTDAAVTFRRHDLKTHETSYIFHGNDGTSMPWNDTAQLDFLNQDTREAVIQQILHVARNFHIIRFDAAMTLAKRHIQRLWYPRPGTGGDIPGRSCAGMSDEEFSQRMPQEFWREVVDRVANEVPDTLLLAEAFWMMEGYFVRTLGMHRVYNSAFMNMLKNQENKKYRDTIKNTLSFDPEVLKRFVNFMNNPDEETAIAQFGNGDKYFGVCTLLATMPGLPMFGHGQIEGFHEKYGMEYQKAYWNEYPDERLVEEHEKRIFPLLKKRYLFSGVESFELFDAIDSGHTAESIFAYVNGTDEQRALIIYNNQYEHAQGRITISAPKLVRLSDGSRITETKTLGECLGLTVGGRRYAVYESFPERLTYIIPSITVFDEGWRVSLKGYETKVCLNIREVEDFDGSYEALFLQLGGKGTKTFENDLSAIRIKPLFKALENFKSQSMLDVTSALVRGKAKVTEIRKFILLAGEAYARLSAIWKTLPQASKETLPNPSHEVQPRDMMRQMENLTACFQKDAIPGLFSIGGSVMVELPLVLNTAFLLESFIPPGTQYAEGMAIADRLLLDRFFSELTIPLHATEEECKRIMRGAVPLATPLPVVMLEVERDNPDPKECLRRLFEMDMFREQVGCNEYQRVLWYRKESFQETVFLIALGVCMHGGERVCDTMSAMLVSWLRSDSVATYKVKELLDNVQPPERNRFN